MTYRVSFGMNEGFLVEAKTEEEAIRIAIKEWQQVGIDTDLEYIYAEEVRS